MFRDCMHLDTRRCIAGQTTADGEEKEGMGRGMGRMGGWGDGGHRTGRTWRPRRSPSRQWRLLLRGRQEGPRGRGEGAPVNSAVGGYPGNEAKIKRDQRV